MGYGVTWVPRAYQHVRTQSEEPRKDECETVSCQGDRFEEQTSLPRSRGLAPLWNGSSCVHTGSRRTVPPGEKGSGLGVGPGLARKHSVILLQGKAEGRLSDRGSPKSQPYGPASSPPTPALILQKLSPLAAGLKATVVSLPCLLLMKLWPSLPVSCPSHCPPPARAFCTPGTC